MSKSITSLLLPYDFCECPKPLKDIHSFLIWSLPVRGGQRYVVVRSIIRLLYRILNLDCLISLTSALTFYDLSCLISSSRLLYRSLNSVSLTGAAQFCRSIRVFISPSRLLSRSCCHANFLGASITSSPHCLRGLSDRSTEWSSRAN